VKCSDVEWTDVIYVKWFCLKWSEVSYGEVLGDKSAMHFRVTLYWWYLIVLWLFYLVFILYCGCFNLFCNVWVCVCVGSVMCVCVCVCMCGFCNVWVCGCFDNCVGVSVICVLVFKVFWYCFVYAYLFLFVTSLRTTATEWRLNCSK